MNLFLFGALIGAVTMFMTMVIISSQAVDEKNRQIIYLRRQLKEQAERERRVNYEADNN
jgi:hypothetical protein